MRCNSMFWPPLRSARGHGDSRLDETRTEKARQTTAGPALRPACWVSSPPGGTAGALLTPASPGAGGTDGTHGAEETDGAARPQAWSWVWQKKMPSGRPVRMSCDDAGRDRDGARHRGARACHSLCAVRSHSADDRRASRVIKRSRSTLATTLAAAIEKLSASPSTSAR